MKVMILNLNSYQEDEQMIKFQRIADKIIEEKIDAICFSEASQRIDGSYCKERIREDNALKIICDKVNEKSDLNYHYAWDFSHFGFTLYEEGVGIVTHLPIESIESRYVSSTTDPFNFKSRNVMKAKIKYKNDVMNIFSVHLGMGGDEYESFELQMDKLNDWVNEENVYTLIAGDFGNDYDTLYYDKIVSKGYSDQYIVAKPEGMKDYTFINPQGLEFRHSSKLRLDYLFAKGNKYRPIDAKRFFLDEDKVSDHVAVCIEFIEA